MQSADDERTLHEVLKSLDKNLDRQTSLKFVFLRGLIYGLGTVIGATILIGILVHVVNTLGLEGFINYLINKNP